MKNRKIKYILLLVFGLTMLIFVQRQPGEQIILSFFGGLFFAYGLGMVLR